MSWKAGDLDALLSVDVDDVVQRGRSLKGRERTAALRDALSSLPASTNPATQLNLSLFIQTLLAFVPDGKLPSSVAVQAANELSSVVRSTSSEEITRSALRSLALLLAKAKELPSEANDQLRRAITAAEASADPEISSFAKRAFHQPSPRRNRMKILLIHGRDGRNVILLEKLIREGGGSVVVLNAPFATGRTLIERFEEEAENADFAVGLLTPDDIAARSNVIFELGLAAGRLGRSRVYVVLEQGTTPPSDLEGFKRIHFTDNVLDISSQLRSELESVSPFSDMRETA